MLIYKEIRSKKGVLHFKRWGLNFGIFSINIHGIYKEDLDKHCHNHPWNIFTIVLFGSYNEKLIKTNINDYVVNKRNILNCAYRNSKQYHKILSLNSKCVYTLAIMGKRKSDWGYLTENGYVNHIEYRKNK